MKIFHEFFHSSTSGFIYMEASPLVLWRQARGEYISRVSVVTSPRYRHLWPAAAAAHGFWLHNLYQGELRNFPYYLPSSRSAPPSFFFRNTPLFTVTSVRACVPRLILISPDAWSHNVEELICQWLYHWTGSYFHFITSLINGVANVDIFAVGIEKNNNSRSWAVGYKIYPSLELKLFEKKRFHWWTNYYFYTTLKLYHSSKYNIYSKVIR